MAVPALPGPLLIALAATPAPAPCAEAAGPAEIALPAGTRLRAAPDASAPPVAVFDADVTLPVLSRCGEFAEVRWEGLRGWAKPGDDQGPDLDRSAPLPDASRLARVRDAMRPLGHEARLGPWRLLTDVAKGELVGLELVAAHLAETWRARYGADADAVPGQSIAIFSSEARYRVFAQADGSRLLTTRGHAGGGLAAFAAGRNALETRVALVHELTHLLDRNAFGDRLPAWVDEGMAEDLAWCRVDSAGRLEPGTLDVYQLERGQPPVAVERSGPQVTAESWLESARRGRLLPLATLTAPDGRLFESASARRDAVTECAMLVRFCLATPERAEKFRAFLRAIPLGGAIDGKALAASLGQEEAALSKTFLEWLRGLPPR